MALTWKTVVAAVGIFSLCFLGIPVTVDPPQDVAVQQSYMLFLQAQNKSYERNSVDFVSKLSHFQVQNTFFCFFSDAELKAPNQSGFNFFIYAYYKIIITCVLHLF